MGGRCDVDGDWRSACCPQHSPPAHPPTNQFCYCTPHLLHPPPTTPAIRLFLPVAPPLTDDDRRVVENVSKLVNFLSGGSAARALSGRLDPRALAELAPLLPGVATQVVPELARRLAGRLAARLLRELYVPER